MARNRKDSYRKNKQAYLNADDDNRFAQIKDVEEISGGVTLTGVQTLTNKTLTTPIVASIYQDAGKTKLFTLPDASSDTLVALTAAQTLTNKVLVANGLSFKEGTPVNAVAASAVLTLTGVVLDAEIVTIGTDIYEFAADAAQAVTAGSIAVDIESDTTKSSGSLGMATQPTAGDTIEIGVSGSLITYTFVTDGTASASGQVDIGQNLGEAQTNIIAAVNGTDGITSAHALVTMAAFGGDVAVVTAIVGGVLGDSVLTTATFDDGTDDWVAGALGSGADCTAADAITALVVSITAHDTQGVGGVDGAGDTLDLTADVLGVAGNAIVSTTDIGNGSFPAGTLLGGIDGTVGIDHEVLVDADAIYVATDVNTIVDANWEKVCLSTDTGVWLATVQTLTNKTLTAPKIVSGDGIFDAGGDELVIFTEDTTPITYIGISSGDTTVAPQVRGAGETNTDLLVAGTGTGNVYVADGADITKDLTFELVGATTGKTMTIISSHTDDRSLTLPDGDDTLVGKATTDTMTNKTLTSPKINEDVICSATATLLNLASVKATYGTRFFYLGTPELDDVDKVVTTANMKVGTYTIAASPDVPRVITITHAAGDTVDTLGTITIAGTDSADAVISEVLTPSNGTIVTGLKAFKTVTSATGAGWVIDGSEATADTITIGCGPALGLPEAIVVSDTNSIGYLDGVADAISAVGSGADVANSTVTITSALDGSATVQILTNAS